MLYKNFSLFFPAITSTNHGLEIMNLGRLYESYDFFFREKHVIRQRVRVGLVYTKFYYSYKKISLYIIIAAVQTTRFNLKPTTYKLKF
jgi:hypothetical protein